MYRLDSVSAYESTGLCQVSNFQKARNAGAFEDLNLFCHLRAPFLSFICMHLCTHTPSKGQERGNSRPIPSKVKRAIMSRAIRSSAAIYCNAILYKNPAVITCHAMALNFARSYSSVGLARINTEMCVLRNINNVRVTQSILQLTTLLTMTSQSSD
ncbi:hypothetical protein BGZ79_002488 [Entomortierella chlamydospora]|nr:hypothetical protein BGZ79_002488 [Entomortierella chlamydospora]